MLQMPHHLTVNMNYFQSTGLRFLNSKHMAPSHKNSYTKRENYIYREWMPSPLSVHFNKEDLWAAYPTVNPRTWFDKKCSSQLKNTWGVALNTH